MNTLSFLKWKKEVKFWSAWVAQLVKHPTGSGHDPMVHRLKPRIKLSVVSTEPSLDPLSPSLCISPGRARSLSLPLSPKNKYNKH